MDYQSQFFVNLYKIYADMDHQYPDVTLHIIEDGTNWKAHRVILAASSDYFKKCFEWSQSAVIDIHNGISGQTMESILKYVYSGTITITPENVNDLLIAANYFVLLDVVNSCSAFILDSVELCNCLEVLMFVWQLNLPKLFDSVCNIAAEKFSELIDDVTLKEQLLSLPLDLTVRLLQSQNLILRHPETRLLTRPHEREILLLQYILEYSKAIDQTKEQLENDETSMPSTNSIISLLTCINWPIISHLGKEDVVAEHFVPYFDGGNQAEEVERLLGASCCTSCTTRSFSCSELVPLHPMANRNVLMVEMIAGGDSARSARKSAVAAAEEHISKLTVIVSTWGNFTYVGGLTAHFHQGGYKHIGEAEENGTEIHEIDLQIDEHIVGVHGRAAWLVDSLTFETSKQRVFGSYGHNGGEVVNFMEEICKYREEGGYHDVQRFDWHDSVVPAPHQRMFLDSVLVGFRARELSMGSDRVALTNLSFLFREMLPTSSFVIKEDKMYELDRDR